MSNPQYKTTSDSPGPGPVLKEILDVILFIKDFLMGWFGNKPRAVWYVQVHDSFSPLQMAPMSSLSMIGHRPMLEMTERPHGVYVRTKPDKDHPDGREFLVPYGNISHYEYDTDK